MVAEPVYSDAMEDLWDLLPAYFRAGDRAQLSWPLKRFLSSMVDQHGIAMEIYRRIDYLMPGEDGADLRPVTFYTNLANNPSYEDASPIPNPNLLASSFAGWVALGTSPPTITPTLAHGKSTMLVAWPTGSNLGSAGVGVAVTVTRNTYTAQVRVWVPSGSTLPELTVYGAGIIVGQPVAAAAALYDQWQTVTLTVGVSAPGTVELQVSPSAAAAAGSVCYVADYRMAPGLNATRDRVPSSSIAIDDDGEWAFQYTAGNPGNFGGSILSSLPTPFDAVIVTVSADVLAEEGRTIRFVVPSLDATGQVSIPAGDQVVLTNGSFEDPPSGGFEVAGNWTRGSASARVNTAGAARSGTWAMDCPPTTDTPFNFAAQTDAATPASPGDQFELSGWAKNHAGVGALTLRIAWIDVHGTQYGASDSVVATATSAGYTQFVGGRVTAPPGTQFARVQVYNLGANSIYVDDVDCRKVTSFDVVHDQPGWQRLAFTVPVAFGTANIGLFALVLDGGAGETFAVDCLMILEGSQPLDLPYRRYSGVLTGSTSELVTPEVADDAWLPWLAQLVGVQLNPNLTRQAKVAAIRSASAGWQSGTKAAIAAAAQTALTGSQYVRVFDHSIAAPGDGGQWDVLILTRTSETPDPAAVLTAVVAQGAKPAGVVLYHASYAASWDAIVADFPTWAAIEGAGSWTAIEEAGL